MKVFVSPLITLIALLGLTACGGKQGSSKLEISTNFVVTGPTNSGGLIAFGKTVDGTSSFSAAAINGSSTSVQIKDGKWKIYVIGYPNSPFEIGSYNAPDTKCGMSEVTLGSQDTNINIALATAKCSDAAFLAATDYKNYFIGSCGSFYGYNYSTDTFSAPTVAHHCDSLSDDLQSNRHQAYRIEVLNSDDTGIKPSTLITQCSIISLRNYLPSKLLALKITTYPTLEDCGQNKKALEFSYPNGISVGNPQKFEHYFQSGNPADTTASFLTLPSGYAKKGKSPFMNLLPRILCDYYYNCIVTPQVPSGFSPDTDVPIVPGYDNSILLSNVKESDFPGKEVKIYDESDILIATCELDSLSECIVNSSISLHELRIEDGNLSAFINQTSTNEIFKIKNIQIETKTPSSGEGFRYLTNLIDLVGLQYVNDEKLTYIFPRLATEGTEVKRGGKVSDAAFLMGPVALGSAVSQFNSCSELYNHLDMIPSKKMTVSQFLVDVHEVNFPITGSFMNVSFEALSTSSSDRINSSWCTASACLTTDKQIKMSFTPPHDSSSKEVLTINCERKVGQLERFENDFGEIRRELLLWDTQTIAGSKFEVYELEQHTDGEIWAYIDRFQKMGANDFGAKLLFGRYIPDNGMNAATLVSGFEEIYHQSNTYSKADFSAMGGITSQWNPSSNATLVGLTSLAGQNCDGIEIRCASFPNLVSNYFSASPTALLIYSAPTFGDNLEAANKPLNANYLSDLYTSSPHIGTLFKIPAN